VATVLLFDVPVVVLLFVAPGTAVVTPAARRIASGLVLFTFSRLK
jgi:hypothetical protein